MLAHLETDWLARYSNVPAVMAEKPNWLLYQLKPPTTKGKKPRKVPMYANGTRRSGKLGRPADREQLVTLVEAIAASRRHGQQKKLGAPGVAGLGFATFEDSDVSCIDLDNCIAPDGSTHFNEHQRRIVEAAELAGAMIELSPSGTGLHIWGRSENRANGKAHIIGVELFSTTGFVTLTGELWGDCEFLGAEFVSITGVVDVAERTIGGTRSPPVGAPPSLTDDKALQRFVPDETVEDLRSALRYIRADERDLWIKMGQALKGLSSPSHVDAGRELYMDWSATSEKHDPEADAATWESFRGDRTDFRTVFAEAQRLGWTNPKSRAAITARGKGVTDEIGKEPLRVCTAATIAALEPQRWIVKGLLPECGVALIYGESGVAKTFITLDLISAIARGVAWCGRRVHQGAVLYVAGEGGGGLGPRFRAYAQYHGVDLDQVPIAIVTDSITLLDGDASRVIAAAREMTARGTPPGVIVLDTLNQTMGGGDENSSLDMGSYLRAVAAIREATGALVLIIHHSGKNAAAGARGHSSLRAAVDVEMELRLEGDFRVLRLTKSRDGRDGVELAFNMIVVPLGVDEDLEPVSSCVVVPSDAVPPRRTELKGASLIAMRELQKLQDKQPPGTGAGVPLDTWRLAAYAAGVSDSSDSGSRRKAFNRARIQLLEKGLIGCNHDDYFTI